MVAGWVLVAAAPLFAEDGLTWVRVVRSAAGTVLAFLLALALAAFHTRRQRP